MRGNFKDGLNIAQDLINENYGEDQTKMGEVKLEDFPIEILKAALKVLEEQEND